MRASDRAYETLLDQIQSGALAPGAVVGEVDQAERLGVSRTPMREAISRLAADGLVAQQSPRITVVTDVNTDDIRALFEVRRALEESAARLAAERGDAAAFHALAEAFDGINPQEDPDGYYELIGEFDSEIDAAVANDYLTAALRPVRTNLVRVRRLARDNPNRLGASAIEHRLIAAAIAAGDKDLAASATHVHLNNALTAILHALPEGHP